MDLYRLYKSVVYKPSSEITKFEDPVYVNTSAILYIEETKLPDNRGDCLIFYLQNDETCVFPGTLFDWRNYLYSADIFYDEMPHFLPNINYAKRREPMEVFKEEKDND